MRRSRSAPTSSARPGVDRGDLEPAIRGGARGAGLEGHPHRRPKDGSRNKNGVFLRTEKSVLFIIPWERYWVIGTTRTPPGTNSVTPVATSEDINYVLGEANSVLADKPTRAFDIIGTFMGLRQPLPLAAEHEARG